jgi:3-deoxy-7-phosphoheptulonate synthase
MRPLCIHRNSRNIHGVARISLEPANPAVRGLRYLRKADRHGLQVVSKMMDQTQISLLASYANILQVGTRNMQNLNLVRELGQLRKPVLLKRGIAAIDGGTAALGEYILAGGNYG